MEDGRYSRRRKHRKTVRERPGLAPSALFHLIGNTVFLRLSDVASGLPPYEEQVLLCSMDAEPDSVGYTQHGAYNHVFDKLREALADALAKGSKRLLAAYLQTLLDGESVITLVVFGEDNAPAQLGTYTLDGLALAVDPTKQRLVPKPLIMY